MRTHLICPRCNVAGLKITGVVLECPHREECGWWTKLSNATHARLVHHASAA